MLKRFSRWLFIQTHDNELRNLKRFMFHVNLDKFDRLSTEGIIISLEALGLVDYKDSILAEQKFRKYNIK